ncbi:hypothetical protein M9435_006076 [Picochlorum sp. BPE23]|nr:hypothetical protein M9435_006076 [Picochlorum sp. BPE23]
MGLLGKIRSLKKSKVVTDELRGNDVAGVGAGQEGPGVETLGGPHLDVDEQRDDYINDTTNEETRVQEYNDARNDDDDVEEEEEINHDGEFIEKEDDGASLDTRSMISESALSDVDVKSGFTELSKVLAAMELEEMQRRENSVQGTTEENVESDISTQDGGELARNLVKLYNDLSVRLMEGKQFDQSLIMLQKAEKLLLEKSMEDGLDQGGDGVVTQSHLQTITYNNMGCLYRRMSLPREALVYLEKALAIEERSGTVHERASTHLNLSASHSVLHHHKEALHHGEKAAVLLQGQLWPGLSFQDGLSALSLQVQALVAHDARRNQLLNDANILAMAYHNIGIEHEHLGQMKEAQVSFTRACSIGTKILGSKSATTAAMIRANKLFQNRNKELHSSHKGSVSAIKQNTHASLKIRQVGDASHRHGHFGKSSKSKSEMKRKASRGTLPFK